MVANKYAFLQITRRRFLNEWEAFKKVISRRNIRRRITIPMTLSSLKLLRRITRTENILHRNFTRRQFAIHIFFFNDTATTEIYTLSLHDALPISHARPGGWRRRPAKRPARHWRQAPCRRSEEHTSELQSHLNLVCRLLLEKKKH